MNALIIDYYRGEQIVPLIARLREMGVILTHFPDVIADADIIHSTLFRADEAKGDAVVPAESFARFHTTDGFSIVFLHTGNPWAKAFAEAKTGKVSIVCYSGDLRNSWYSRLAQRQENLRGFEWNRICYFMEDFFRGSSSGNFAWDVFEGGRKMREFLLVLLPLDILIQGALIYFEQHGKPVPDPKSWWSECCGNPRVIIGLKISVSDWLVDSMPTLTTAKHYDLLDILEPNKVEVVFVKLLRRFSGDGEILFDEEALLSDETSLLECHNTFIQMARTLCE